MITIIEMNKIIEDYCNEHEYKCDVCCSDNSEGCYERMKERFIKIAHEKIEEYCKKRERDCDNCCLEKLHLDCNDYHDDIDNLYQCYNTIVEHEQHKECYLTDDKEQQEKVREVEAEFYQLQLTKTQIETLKKFIESNLYREKLKADSLCDICDIYKQLKI